MKIITISRECGSGGHSLAVSLAKELNIPCYDKEIISMVAEKCNVSEEYANNVSEVLQSHSFSLFSISNSGNVFPYATPSLQDQINGAQIEIIKQLAEKGPCIIVGRGADYILRERNDVLNIFVKASMDYKIQSSFEKHNLNKKEAEKTLLKRDKERARHYSFYTGREWGNIKNYDIVIDTSKFGIDGSVSIIKHIYTLNNK